MTQNHANPHGEPFLEMVSPFEDLFFFAPQEVLLLDTQTFNPSFRVEGARLPDDSPQAGEC